MTKETIPVGGVEMTAAEIEDAKKEGVIEHLKEGGKRAAAVGNDLVPDAKADEKRAEAERLQVDPSLNTTPLAPLLDLGEDELKRRLNDHEAKDFIEFENAKGLLALERAGKNRTGYVKLLLDAIGTDDPFKVTNSGPPFTNDTSSLTSL